MKKEIGLLINVESGDGREGWSVVINKPYHHEDDLDVVPEIGLKVYWQGSCRRSFKGFHVYGFSKEADGSEELHEILVPPGMNQNCKRSGEITLGSKRYNVCVRMTRS